MLVMQNNPQGPESFSMTPEEARQVPWLPAWPVPMGELFDAGYLNVARLEWAVARARDPRIKRAAMVLLKQPRPRSASSISPDTLERARAAAWPYPPYAGRSIGGLVAARQLSLQELGRAAETASDEPVRRAAAAMLRVRLAQNARADIPPAGYLQVYSAPRTFAARPYMQKALAYGAVLGLVLGVLLGGGLYWILTRPARSGLTLQGWLLSPPGLAALALLLGVIGVTVLFFLLRNRLRGWLEAAIEADRRDRDGLTRVADIAAQTFDGNWTFFRDLRLPRSGRPLEAVLVGPSGIWALVVRDRAGVHRNKGDRWEVRQGKGWKAWPESPGRQARLAAARLKGWLKGFKIKAVVYSAVVWADQEEPLALESPAVEVWPLERLADELGNLWGEEELHEALREKVIAKLAGLYAAPQEPRMVPRPGAVKLPAGEE